MIDNCISGMYLQTQIFLKLKKKWYGTTLQVIIKKRTNFGPFLIQKNVQKIPKKVLTICTNRYTMLRERRYEMIMKKLHIDIDEEIKFKLDELAKNRGMRTNELIRFILSEYLLKKGKE